MFGLRSPAHCAKAGFRFDGWDGLVTKTSLMVVRTFRPALGVFGAGTCAPPKKHFTYAVMLKQCGKQLAPESLRPFLGRNPVNPQVPLMGIWLVRRLQPTFANTPWPDRPFSEVLFSCLTLAYTTPRCYHKATCGKFSQGLAGVKWLGSVAWSCHIGFGGCRYSKKFLGLE